MRAKYFADTDTLLVNFSDRRIVETRDLGEDMLVELDKDGHVVSLTIEHARQQTNVREFVYELADTPSPASAAMAVREPRASYGKPSRQRRR